MTEAGRMRLGAPPRSMRRSSADRGGALVAKRAGAEVQTVLPEVSPPCLAKGWPLFRRPALPVICRARRGRRFAVTGDVHDFVDGLRACFTRELEPPRGPG